MGNDLHITRKDNWSDEDGPIITLDEWMAYVVGDVEIQDDNENGPEDFVYVAHPNGPVPLWWGKDGEIYSKNPDKFTVKKLLEIADHFSAAVQGDDGEEYTDWTTFDE